MSEMQEGIQMAMMTGQAMAFVVDKGVTLTRQILEALAKLMKMSALYTAPKIKNAWKRQPGAVSMDQIQRRIPISSPASFIRLVINKSCLDGFTLPLG